LMWKTPDEACVDEVGDWVVGVVAWGGGEEGGFWEAQSV
jgi:hypothetical protein